MPDRFVVRAVVVGLLAVGMLVIVGAVVLSATGHTIPDPLWTLAGTSVGAVAGILSKTNTEPGPVQPVSVVNTAAAPVPVDPTTDDAGADETPERFPSPTARKVALGSEKRTRPLKATKTTKAAKKR